MDKQQLSERDICTQYITPALIRSGWELATQVREEFSLTNGRILVRGKLHARARNKRADYVLFYKPNLPIAVIEAKDNRHSLGDGMQQGLGYGELLQVPFIWFFRNYRGRPLLLAWSPRPCRPWDDGDADSRGG